MKNSTIFIALLLSFSVVNAQTIDSSETNHRIDNLEQQNMLLKRQLIQLEQRAQELAIQVSHNSEKVNLLGEVVEQKVGGLHGQMDSIDEQYGLRMSNTETAVQETGVRQQKSITWGIIIAVVLTIITVVVYLLLHKRIAKKGDDIELLRARADDLNRQMVERMDKELAELQKIVSSLSVPGTGATHNHDIVLAVGDNLAIMESNLYRMDAKTPGYRTLTRAVEKMKNNLLQKGYDFVNMLGTEYVDGMNVDKVVFKDDENIEEGKQIITAVRRPQINYNGTAIQLANIEVSQNI
mgnify:FL=1